MGEFQQRLRYAMEICGISQAELAEKTNLSKPRISQYVNGIYEAKQDALLKLSKALNVDVAWLMGYDVPMNAKLEELAEDKQITDLLSSMTREEKLDLLDYIRFIISKRKS